MPATSKKSMSQIKWANGTSWVWDWNSNQSGGYAGHNSSNGYYTTVLQFKTPSFTGLATSVKFTVYAKNSGGTSPQIRAAISSSTANQSRYLNTGSAVTEANQVAARTVTFSNMSSSYQGWSFTIHLESIKLEPGKTYYLFLWAYGSGTNLIMLSTATTHTFVVNYNKVTTPVLSASAADMGTTVTISTENAPITDAVHDLTYQLADGSTGVIADKVGLVSVPWKVVDCGSLIPDGLSTPIAITCTTYDASGTDLGSVTLSLMATVPASVVPVISSVTVTEAVSGLAEKYKGFVQSKSRVKVEIAASGAGGSTVSDVVSTLEGRSYGGASWAADVLTGSGTLEIRTTVTDSRGRMTSRSTVISVAAYTPPKITAFSVWRTASAAADAPAASDGDHAAIRYAYNAPSLNGGNTISMVVRAKRATAADYTVTLLSGSALSADTTGRPAEPLSSDYRWDIRMTVTDSFGAAVTATVQLPSAAVVMDVAADGLGLGIGKTAEGPGLDVAWPIAARKGVTGDLAGAAEKLGRANVGDAGTPVYLEAGSPKPVTPAAVRGTIGAAPAWRVLWTNPNPTANFAAQTLTIEGLSACNLLCIGWLREANKEERASDFLYVNTSSFRHTGSITYGSGGVINNFYRVTTTKLEENTIQFEAGHRTLGSSSSNNVPSVMVPQYILGAAI